ncbi:MAG: hypothetical protein HQL08_01930 [Nitrospirae bacterium]|nr:hypothetical protein [Nitrospirota bacterium]
MAYKALKAAHLPFELVRSEDIKKGALFGYKLLFVPGGWASNKIKTLGADGILQIKEFVGRGGNYLGFCGGAGLATADGIGLLNIRRKPTKDRVPSFSGRIRLNLSEHPIWQDITDPVFHAWWPSQFLPDRDTNHLLAAYGAALPDSFSSDLNVGDTVRYGDWADSEKNYGINLNPERLLDDPAVVEGAFGDGKVLLSLVHFDTPEDSNGTLVLKNIWNYLQGMGNIDVHADTEGPVGLVKDRVEQSLMDELESAADELISLGLRNFLWFWRNPMLLQWRRGVRGLEYCTLFTMIKEIAALIRSGCNSSLITSHSSRIKNLLLPFSDQAKRLLILERQAMLSGPITYEMCNNPEIQKMRTWLFGNSKSHGGLFKELIDAVDELLYSLL